MPGAPGTPGGALPPQTPQGKFDPVPPGTPADAARQAAMAKETKTPAEATGQPPEAAAQAAAQSQAIAQAMTRSVGKEEFFLTLAVDGSVVAKNEAPIEIDVISTDFKSADELKADGPDKYYDSRITGATAISHIFEKGERVGVRVPTISPADAIVLWAKLGAPAEGRDTRMLVIPLALDKSDPKKGPIANPIGVRLTSKGWVRES